MLRLCREGSRPYPGRPVRRAVTKRDSAYRGNTAGDRTGVSRGHSRCRKTILCFRNRKETSREIPRGNRWRTHPTEGLNMKNEEEIYHGLV